jgi:phage terminase large subunit
MEYPAILAMPPKMKPIITEFNSYDVSLTEGGRLSAKSQSVGRLLLYLGEIRKLRIVCGREVAANIEESVYTLLKDLITEYQLAYDVFAYKIVHRTSGTEIRFKGFREQGSVNVKGLEGVDILWIDEAQSITRHTLSIIDPTIRKTGAKMFFTMNRFLRDDAVPEFYVGKPKTLHIKINYFENPFCPLAMKVKAEDMLIKNERDYRHIYLGEPLTQADDYLFNFDKLHNAFNVKPFGEMFKRQRILAIDFAAQGNDQCVASVLDRMSNQHWQLSERLPWNEPDTMISVGKIVAYIGQFKPDLTIIDIGGMGKVVFDRLNEVFGSGSNIKIMAFDGGSTQGVDTNHYGNCRSEGYHLMVDWFDSGFLCLDKKDMEVVKQLEKIKVKYHSNGVRYIQAKVDMKKELHYSPDDADSLMMAIYCAAKYLGKSANDASSSSALPTRRNISRRER